ncbi:MAG: hypothetical protein E7267_07100 [Lachnospiraceae bacterium]|nr:hypothetical protein [Lachnospiraceae bacterium]
MIKKITLLILTILACISFAGCKSNDVKHDYEIYYLNESGTQLVSEGFDTKITDKGVLISEFIDRMEEPKDESDHFTPGLDITKIIDYQYNTDGYVTLVFDAAYTGLKGFKEVLCRAAIVKTICQIEGINGVEFYINEMPHVDENGQLYGYMTQETFVDNTSGDTKYKQTVNANLYFADKNGNKLVKVPITVTFDGTISLAQLVLQQLVNGPENIGGTDDSVKASVSGNTKINKITIREHICYVDLSKDFLTQVKDVKREVTLYSVVNTLADLIDVNKVQFTIDGETVNFFGDTHIIFDAPFERNLDIVANPE